MPERSAHRLGQLDGSERMRELDTVARAPCRVLREHAHHQSVELGGQVAAQHPRRNRIFHDRLREDRERIGAVERWPADEAAIKNASERKDVGAWINGRSTASL